MRRKKILGCLVLLLSAPVSAITITATTTLLLTLQDAILLALRYNPSVQTAEIQRVIDKFNLRVAENVFMDLNRNENMTLVLVTHDQNIAARCQRVVKISDGMDLS